VVVVERLLQDERVDPSASNNEATRAASREGHVVVVERLLQDERVDPSAQDNDAIRSAVCKGYSAVVERLLQDKRVDPTALHRMPFHEHVAKQYSVATLTDAMLPRLAVTLSLPFAADSCILLWQPRLRQYRAEQIAFLESLIASWRWHGGGLCRDIVENIVSEYVLGGLKLREYRALDAEYVAPGPTAAEMAAVEEELVDVKRELRDAQAAMAAMRVELTASKEAALQPCQCQQQPSSSSGKKRKTAPAVACDDSIPAAAASSAAAAAKTAAKTAAGVAARTGKKRKTVAAASQKSHTSTMSRSTRSSRSESNSSSSSSSNGSDQTSGSSVIKKKRKKGSNK
jgi:hypothetical protein